MLLRMIKRLILGTLLLFYWSFCYAEKSNPPSIDSVFPTLNQEVYPFKNYGITETNIIGQLPDGRVFLITDSGDAFIFNGKSWQLMPDSFPESVSKTYVDSEGLLWIGGVGYFGYMDESFEYIEFSTSEFAGQITSSLPFYWIYETDEWLHFANNKTICHYNRITKEKKVTKFEGMFDAYHWIHRGELYLGTKSKIEKWFNGEFQHNLDWNHEYRAFHGWEHEGREYFLNATHLYVYEGDTHVQTIRDELMKMKGVVHLPVGEYVYLFTLNGMIQMSLNGKCDGYFFPWFHERVTRSTIHSPQYFGNGDAWFLTDNAIFRINSFEYAKDLSVETGYPITGSWDIENHNGDVYVASGRGFEKWHSTERNFSEPEGAPDFATYGIWKYKEELIISTWVELGSYEDQYSIKRSDGTYVVFAKSNQDGRFWVNKDSGIVLMDENFDIVTKVKGIAENVSSFVEFKGLLWVVSTDGRLFRANWEEQASLSDASHWFLESSGLTEPEPMRILSFGERLYLMTAKQWFEIKENQVFPVSFPIKKGWSWEIPHYSSEEDAIMLLQRNDRQNGCKIGILQEDTEGNLTWSPGYVLIESSKDSVRRLKRLEGFKENLAAVISSTSLELVKLDELPDTLPKLNPPIFVGSVNDLGVSDGRTYRFNPNSPLAIQLHHSKNSLQRPLTYAARLSKKGQSWIFREDGSFMYPGFLRGKLTFDAYVVDPWGNRSDIVSHTIRIIPPWYLSNYAIIAYLCLLFSTIVLSVQLRTRQLRRKSKELENIVDARTTDLMLANQAKSIFVSNVSHEIRNPLNGLLGLAQNLNEGDVIDKGTLQRLRRPSFYLYRFLSNVLDFSKFEAGGIRLNKRVFDPNELMDSVESMFAGDFQERNLTFVADYRYENDPFLCTAQEAIEMILVNLVGNAVKFTPPGGNIRTAMQYSDGWLTLTVADTGIGISDQAKERIFEPYEQGEQSPLVTGEKGAGIGLSLVK
ncbi:MAG: HAMP domain-containing histidine kinase, partial [Opitutales bacterium]|nr:HAMP domain-containing histidine kinase [Opitutales bacterium]